MPAEMDIINECAIALCKFFKRDPDETIYVNIGVTGALTVQRPLWQLVRGRVFEAVREISKLEAIKPPAEPDGE